MKSRSIGNYDRFKKEILSHAKWKIDNYELSNKKFAMFCLMCYNKEQKEDYITYYNTANEEVKITRLDLIGSANFVANKHWNGNWYDFIGITSLVEEIKL